MKVYKECISQLIIILPVFNSSRIALLLVLKAKGQNINCWRRTKTGLHTLSSSHSTRHKNKTFLPLGHFFCQFKCECLLTAPATEFILVSHVSVNILETDATLAANVLALLQKYFFKIIPHFREKKNNLNFCWFTIVKCHIFTEAFNKFSSTFPSTYVGWPNKTKKRVSIVPKVSPVWQPPFNFCWTVLYSLGVLLPKTLVTVSHERLNDFF